MDGKVNFIIIKTKSQGVFISDNIKGDSYFNSKIPNLFFDGLKSKTTFKKDWYKILKIPQKIEIKGRDEQINKRFELKSGFPISELTPQTILYNDWDDNSEIGGLYSLKYDTLEGSLESIEFETEILSEEESFYIEKPKYNSTVNLIDALTTHPALHLDKPSNISAIELYKIVRNFIKLNIDNKYARITSDYDFCLTVKKIISHEPISYTATAGTKRRPKYETRYRREREVVIFECAPKSYDTYTVLKEITGKNYVELEQKIEKYLEELITLINEPYKECSCCGGLGVVLK